MCRRALAASVLAALGAVSSGAAEPGALTSYGRHLASECTACHRLDGVEGAIPSIAGKPAAEFIGLLRDYREGRKTNPVMVSVARSLDERQMAALAQYFASLPKSASDAAPPR